MATLAERQKALNEQRRADALAAQEARKSELAAQEAEVPQDGGGWTMPSWLRAAVPGGLSASMMEVPEEKRVEAFQQGMSELGDDALSFATNAAETATFNLGDDVLNLMLAGVGGRQYLENAGVEVPEDAGYWDRFEMLSDQYNKEQGEITEAAPVSGMLGDVAGAVVGAPGKLAKWGFSKVAPVSVPKAAGAGAVLGGTEAGLLSAFDDKSAVEVGLDAGGGMLGGAIGAPLAKGVSAISAAVTNSKAGKLALEYLENSAKSPLTKEALQGSGNYLDQGREAIDNAATQIGNMHLGSTRREAAHVAKEKLVPLQERVIEDINNGVDVLNDSVRKAVGVKGNLPSKLEIVETDYRAAKETYDNMIKGTGSFALDVRATQRAVNDAFNQTVGKGGALSRKARKVRDNLNKELATLYEQQPNGQWNVKSLIEFRKDIASKMRVKNPGKLGNAYAGYASAVDRIDKMLDKATGGLYSTANKQYEIASAFADGMDDGEKMLRGIANNAEDIDYQLAKVHPSATPFEADAVKAMNDGRRLGAARAMLRDSDKGVTKMLRNLMGDEVNPGTMDQYKLDKLEALFPGATEELMKVYRAEGPRIDSLVRLYDTIDQRIAQPQSAAAAQRSESDRAQLMYGALTKGLKATSSPAFVGAMSREFSPVDPSGLTPQASDLFINALNKQGQGFERAIGRMNTQEQLMDFLEGAPPAGAVAGGILGGGDLPYEEETLNILGDETDN